MGHRMKRLWLRLVHAWRRDERTQRNVEAVRREPLWTADSDLDASIRRQNRPPGT